MVLEITSGSLRVTLADSSAPATSASGNAGFVDMSLLQRAL